MRILFDAGEGPTDTLRFMEEKAGAGLWTLDLQTSRMEWSGGMFALLGLERDQVQPSYKAINALIHPDDQSVGHDIDRFVREGVPFDRVFRIIRQNGRMRWLLNRGETLFNAAGQPERAIGIMQDVTGHREAIQSLTICGQRYRSLVLAADAIVWTSRPDGQVTDCSLPAGPSGSTLVQFTGDRWRDLIHPDDLPATLAAWNAAVTAQRPYEFEHRVRRTDGDYRWHRSRAMPVLRAGDAVQEWVGISIDIHDQKSWPTAPNSASALTGFQVRAGRGMLKWAVRDLAEKSGISPGIIRRLEESDAPLEASDEVVAAIHAAFTQAGVEFLFPPNGKPAVRPA